MFPHYRQHDAMDCGPTCLRMIAAHYGRVYYYAKSWDEMLTGKDHIFELVAELYKKMKK
jgi:ATP-binding cassette subfamily B protein